MLLTSRLERPKTEVFLIKMLSVIVTLCSSIPADFLGIVFVSKDWSKCVAFHSWTLVIFRCFVNNKAIRIGSRFRTTHDFGYVALDVLQSYAEDSGTYMCRATNKLGEAVNSSSVSIIGECFIV